MGESCLGLGINLISRMQYLPAIPLLEESFANYQQVAMAMGVTGLSAVFIVVVVIVCGR